jgi:hypothetical protein
MTATAAAATRHHHRHRRGSPGLRPRPPNLRVSSTAWVIPRWHHTSLPEIGTLPVIPFGVGYPPLAIAVIDVSLMIDLNDSEQLDLGDDTGFYAAVGERLLRSFDFDTPPESSNEKTPIPRTDYL